MALFFRFGKNRPAKGWRAKSNSQQRQMFRPIQLNIALEN